MEDQWKLVPEELNFHLVEKALCESLTRAAIPSCRRRVKQRRQRCRQWDDNEADCGDLNVGSRWRSMVTTSERSSEGLDPHLGLLVFLGLILSDCHGAGCL